MRRREGLEGDSSTGELSPSNCGRIAWGFRPGRRGDRGSCRARPRCLAGGGTTGGVALRAPGPPPPRSVLGTAETAAALVANPGTTICTDGCAGGTCVGGRAQAFVWAAILTATAPAVANRYTFLIREKWVEGPLELRTPASAGAAAAGDNNLAEGNAHAIEPSICEAIEESRHRPVDPSS